MASERGKLFTSGFYELQLLAAAQGQTGQQQINLGNKFAAKADRNLLNVTASRVWIKGVWRWGNYIPAVTPVWSAFALGVVRATEFIDAVDQADLLDHEGDLMLHDIRVLKEPIGDALNAMDPDNTTGGAVLDLQSRGQRKLARNGETLFLVASKRSVTEQDVALTVAVTILWLLP